MLDMQQAAPDRIYLFDNIKAGLIFLVVLGHMLELCLGGLRTYAYTLIYCFHMPLFIFCSGCFARYQPRRLWERVLYPYVLFQLIYWYLFQRGQGTGLSFFTPYWTLWYLLALFIWTLALPFWEMVKEKRRLVFILLAFAFGLLIGFDSSAGYFLSVSRAAVFFPFFLLGQYLRNSRLWDSPLLRPEPGRHKPGGRGRFLWAIRAVTGFSALALAFWIYRNQAGINPTWLYCSFGYGYLKYKVSYRLLHYGAALVFSAAALAWAPRGRHWFTVIGERCLQIYLLHGLLIKLWAKFELYRYPESHLLVWCVALSAALTLILAAGPITRLARPFLTWPFFAGRKEKKDIGS
ncbi:MAG: acyltransferase family protein [Peptococcaceae bacterium]|nr:acyltransferase family protein [Peptococcaceae bacterium]